MNNVAKEVTQSIIDALKSGVAPWRSPYTKGWIRPVNMSTGKEYTGANVLLLNAQRFADPRFLTYKQAQDMGLQVRRGEKGCAIVKAGRYDKEQSDGSKKDVFFMRWYSVFNACQLDGHVPELPDAASFRSASEIVDGMPNAPRIEHGFSVGCYSPSEDVVRMPDLSGMASPEHYYRVLFHELAHSTGHPSRLDRKLAGQGDILSYSEEELVAEIAGCHLLTVAGFPDPDNAASYCAYWLGKLSGEKEANVMKAASAASKAADYILGKQPSE